MLNPVETDMRAFREMSVDAPVSKRERSTVAGHRGALPDARHHRFQSIAFCTVPKWRPALSIIMFYVK